MRTPEVELVLACASSAVDAASVAHINRLIDRGVDWDAFVAEGRSTRADIIPLVHHNLSAPGVAAPAWVIEKFRGWHQQLAGFTLHNARALGEIADALQQRGIAFLPFKGPTLAAFAYKDVLLRTARDLDVLVHKPDFAAARAALESLGYRVDEDHPPRASAYFFDCGFGLRMSRPGELISVELHWRLIPHLASFPIDYARLWRRAGTIEVLGRRLPTFAPEDLLLYVCAHANWPGHSWVKLRWICDIAEFTRRDGEFDWDVLLQTAREARATRLLLLGLYLARRLVPRTTLPPRVAAMVDGERRFPRLGDRVETWLFGARAELPRNFERVRFYAQTRESWADRVRDRLQLWGNDTQLILALSLPRRLHVLYWVLGPLWKAGRHVVVWIKKPAKQPTRAR